MSLRTIRVAVAHEDFLTRTGLMTVLAACDDMSLEAANTDDLSLAACDAIVADFLGGQRIPFNLRRARTIQHRGRVMVVADADREWQVREALESGAAAYLLLDATAGELVEAVRRVARGASYLSPPVAARLAESLAADPLTGRGQQVLSLIVDALCNKRIASRLQISVGTVESHMRSLFDKLNVRTRTAAAATAARRGLLRRRINSTGIDPEGGAAMGLAIPPPGRDRGNRVREGVPEQTTLLLQA
jgi:DNA-binding NarL/FixJ family response regulator